MADVVTKYDDYTQIDDADLVQGRPVTICDQFWQRGWRKPHRYPVGQQPTATVFCLYFDKQMLDSDIRETACQKAVSQHTATTRDEFVDELPSWVFREPEEEIELLVRMPPKSVRHARIRVVGHTKAVPNPIVFPIED